MQLLSRLMGLVVAMSGLGVLGGEVTRGQFTKQQLDSFGYPTNSVLAAELGRSEARRDLTKGVVQIPVHGLRALWTEEFDRILEERYHVGRLGLGGCLVSESLVAYGDGYFEVSRRFIESQHGTNLWEEVRLEAEKAFAEKLETEAGSGNEVRSGGTQTHRVKSGDTLIKIAHRHGLTLKSILEANPGVDPRRLKVNQMLRLPAVSKLSDKP